jgi:hypothetical protein
MGVATGRDWKIKGFGLYSFPKKGKISRGWVCGGGRISTGGLIEDAVQADNCREGVDEVAVEGIPVLEGAVIEDVQQAGAVVEGTGGDMLQGGGDGDGLQIVAAGKAPGPMVTTPPGRCSPSREEQPEKAIGPMISTDSGRMMVVRVSQPAKQPGPMPVTVWPPMVPGTFRTGLPSQLSGRNIRVPSARAKQPSSAREGSGSGAGSSKGAASMTSSKISVEKSVTIWLMAARNTMTARITMGMTMARAQQQPRRGLVFGGV